MGVRALNKTDQTKRIPCPRADRDQFCQGSTVFSVFASRFSMSNWQTKFLAAILVPIWVIVTLAGNGRAAAAEEHSVSHVRGSAADQLPDIEEVVDQMTGQVPEGEEAHAVDYHQPPLMPELPLFLFTLILFAGFVLVMRSVVWKPLLSGLDSREQRIVKAETQARAARLEVEQLTAQAEQRMAEVYQEVKTIVAQARADAEAKKLEIVTQAEADAQRIKQEALAAIAQARSAALAELEQTVDQQVGLATQFVAGRRI